MSRLFAFSLAGLAAAALALPLSAADEKKAEKNIVETAKSAGQFETLLTAAKAAGLAETLSKEGPFTVFAPTDEAFAKVPQTTLASVSKDDAMLTKVLTYHVLEGRIEPDEIAGTHKTLEGASLKVTGTGDQLKVDGAAVICGGVQTANATVYLIDGVLMPKS